MHKTVASVLLALVGLSALGSNGRVGASSFDTNAMQSACASLSAYDERNLLRVTRWLVTTPSISEFRADLQVGLWPADSVVLVQDSALCSTLDALIMTWLAGPGAGKLVGIGTTAGPLGVARIGPTQFHVKPTGVPPQPIPQYPWFVVDTLSPARVIYWGQSG